MRPRLQRVEREQRLLSKGDGDEDAWGFRRGARLIPWTRERPRLAPVGMLKFWCSIFLLKMQHDADEC